MQQESLKQFAELNASNELLSETILKSMCDKIIGTTNTKDKDIISEVEEYLRKIGKNPELFRDELKALHEQAKYPQYQAMSQMQEIFEAIII